MSMTNTGPATFRYIGTSDECTECQHCGKAGLRSTVVIMPLDAEGNDEGEVTYYGSTCAAYALAIPGGGAKVRKAAQGAAYRTRIAAEDARRMLAHYGVTEDGEIVHERGLNGVAFEYRYDNSNAFHPHTRHTWAEWKEQALDMIARKTAAIREARLIGA